MEERPRQESARQAKDRFSFTENDPQNPCPPRQLLKRPRKGLAAFTGLAAATSTPSEPIVPKHVAQSAGIL